MCTKEERQQIYGFVAQSWGDAKAEGEVSATLHSVVEAVRQDGCCPKKVTDDHILEEAAVIAATYGPPRTSRDVRAMAVRVERAFQQLGMFSPMPPLMR